MTATLRQTATTVANAMIEGASMASALIGGAAGAYLGYQLTPATWADGIRILLAGAVAVVGAVAIDGLAELALAPLRRLMRDRSPLPSTRRSAPAPAATLDAALAQVITATEEDAARRAANASHRVDDGDNFLNDASRWRGYEDGEATFYLAPGVVLHHRAERSEYKHHFTLLTGDGEEPVVITGMEQIRHHLAARAAGLPAVPATVATEAGNEHTDSITELDNDMKVVFEV
ncbi:hypothetical protein [Streptomyces drozdowiczii]|uniref:Uncharacterized protein n=1 Tax=Streptomyces drozdowiczii TaxID=202862 RepID=A0ABY6Q101_9ACTN|nr:hypothetical protein [Streptomyces drozdowiczii]MCX0241849.1 hypothetical protein [Streptomyces drozdowiczii]UZK58305.1 hypothetical protein NEH16_33285 [Streptomyces drozdowiczii]